MIVDRKCWSAAADRKSQRRAECEDGISWLSSSSTRPCVITLPCGRKLVTEYLYRRDRAISSEIERSLQKHEIWLVDKGYQLVDKHEVSQSATCATAAAGPRGLSKPPTGAQRNNVRRPTTPMPSRCIVHYIDKRHAVWHMQPPRVELVPQPACGYTRADELVLSRTRLAPLVSLHAGVAPTPTTPAQMMRLIQVATPLASSTPRSAVLARGAAPAAEPARDEPSGDAPLPPRPAHVKAPAADDDFANWRRRSYETANPPGLLRPVAVLAASQTTGVCALGSSGRFLECETDILGALFSFEGA